MTYHKVLLSLLFAVTIQTSKASIGHAGSPNYAAPAAMEQLFGRQVSSSTRYSLLPVETGPPSPASTSSYLLLPVETGPPSPANSTTSSYSLLPVETGPPSPAEPTTRSSPDSSDTPSSSVDVIYSSASATISTTAVSSSTDIISPPTSVVTGSGSNIMVDFSQIVLPALVGGVLLF